MYAVQPRARRQREQEAGQQPGGGQEAHLLGRGAKGQGGNDRDREQRDLVAEDGDRLAQPQVAEGLAMEQGRKHGSRIVVALGLSRP